MAEQLVVFAMLHLVAICVGVGAAISMASWRWLRRRRSRYQARRQLRLLLTEGGILKDDPYLKKVLDDYEPRKPN